MNSRIRQFYARVLFLYFGLRFNKVMIEFFLYKILVSHARNPYSLGVGDYM